MNQTNQLRFFPRIFLLLFEYFTLYPCLPSQKKTRSQPVFFTETEAWLEKSQVTGGTGALGLVFAEWMASLGAR